MSKISIIIPARFKSTRFPGKPLAKILGKEMILRVCDICKKVINKKHIYVATDNSKIISKVKDAGYNFIRTKSNCLTGTDRVYQANKIVKSKIIINVQGDEPIINPNDIKKIIKAKIRFPNYVICGYNEIPFYKAENKNIPKVVFNRDNEMIYMSRAAIPSNKTKNKKNYKIHKQVCIYGFNSTQLKKFGLKKKKENLEKIEDIEILRFLDLRIKIKMIKVSNKSLSVDEKQDIKKVENFLRK
tara:strand:- start:1032 stop:1760 length:729 start_codon:yes stop_codon:yes gene_type:complete